jgi:hypothetical protein
MCHHGFIYYSKYRHRAHNFVVASDVLDRYSFEGCIQTNQRIERANKSPDEGKIRFVG